MVEQQFAWVELVGQQGMLKQLFHLHLLHILTLLVLVVQVVLLAQAVMLGLLAVQVLFI
jgi:hypothetical protein